MPELSIGEKETIEEFLHEKGLPTDIDLTFGDVTLPDEYSDIRSRSEIQDFRVSCGSVQSVYRHSP